MAITITTLSGLPGNNQAYLVWAILTNPCLPYLKLKHTEVWRASVNNRSSATKIADVENAFSFLDQDIPQEDFWYWVRAVDASNVAGDFYPTSSTGGVYVRPTASLALSLNLSSEACVLPSTFDGVVTDYSGATTTATVLDGNTDVTDDWSLFISASTGVTASLSTNVVTVTSMSDNAASGYVIVTASKSGAATLEKKFSLTKSEAGAPTYTGYLTSETKVIPANSSGVVSDWSQAFTYMKVSFGEIDDTANWNFSINTKSPSITASVTNSGVDKGKLTITNMTTDSGIVELVAVKGTQSIYKTFTLTKGKQGVNGSNGATGPQGTRGSGKVYVPGHTTWSSSAASSAIVSTYGNGPYVNDEATLYGTNFAQTRRYDGSSWVLLGQVIDGNLTVNGTISTNKIAVGTFTGFTLTGNTITSNTLSSNTITASDITTSTFTGGTIRTSDSTTRRVTMTGSDGRIIAYNDANQIVATFGLSASGGGGITSISSNNNPGISGAANSTGPGLYGYNNGGTGPGVTGERMGAARGHIAYNTAAFYAEAGGYAPFTGQHEGLLPKELEFIPGDILIDVEVVSKATGVSDCITEVSPSSAPLQRGAIGVCVIRSELAEGNIPAAMRELSPQEITDLSTQYDVVMINALGEGQINVTGEGGDIEIGDLIVTSSTLGKGMRLSKDNMHAMWEDGYDTLSYVVARARERVTFSNPNEVKTIACIYKCG